jgi:hypothetical protein
MVSREQEHHVTVPTQLSSYRCQDYFDSEYAQQGFWDEESQLQVITPASEAELLPGVDFLSVGRAGVDGILFGYRSGSAGLWAYYPIGREFMFVAGTIDEFIERWIAGSITL